MLALSKPWARSAPLGPNGTATATGSRSSTGNGATSEHSYRHALKAHREVYDEDSGLTHAAHAAWNALAVLELLLREAEEGPEL